ncbi:hypothetical protein [Rariglobus hedericola]|uniref:DUF4175 domain-containing protein n=1 Tax=Rariglobus hedericola TaxID=2597822 RepID=A0A556QS49_9BACT|nr:hypothetical protein [Rariglobus hedericola]TSJ79467.1 hypothetical protein FPL22_09320 [Rariglobus hedericola]
MKTSHTRRLTLAATCVLLATINARAADESLRPIAFQNGVNQQSLGTETAELSRDITDLIEELQRNGFPLQSLSGLTELAAQLNALGGTEMTAIAARLRKLGENAQADPRATATEAYVAQQAIEARLKSLARQISIQRLREEAVRRLEALIARQTAIQRETKAIYAVNPDAERRRLLESDQSGMGDDLTTFFQTGENLVGRLREKDAPAGQAAPATPDTTGSFTQRVNGTYLASLSTEALDHIKGQRYVDAFRRQDYLIAELRKILVSTLESIPKEQRLANALQQVSALRQQEEANNQNKSATPESKQEAADRAKNLADQVASVSPEASKALNDAQKALNNEKPDAKSDAKPDKQQASADQKQPNKSDPANQQNQQQQANNQQQNGQQQPGQKQPDSQQGQQTPDKNGQQQAQNAQQQPGQQQPGQPDKQDGQPQDKNGQQQAEQGQQKGQQSEAGKALATAEDALRKALDSAQKEAQAQNGQGQQNQDGQKPDGQQQAGQQGQQQNGQQQAQNGQQPGQQPGQQQGQQPGQQSGQQQGQQQAGQGAQQQQGQQNGQGQQTAQTGQNGQSPNPNQQQGQQSGTGEGGDAQDQIAGHGPEGTGPAQTVGALRREEREAFTALQGERYPAEYSAWVQQYWRNLAQEQ